MKMTQEDFAKKIGYSKAIIGFWENGVKQPTLDALIAISKAFAVSIDSLAGLENECIGKAQENYSNINNSFICNNNKVNIKKK